MKEGGEKKTFYQNNKGIHLNAANFLSKFQRYISDTVHSAKNLKLNRKKHVLTLA